MRIAKIDGADPVPLGAPRDWDPDKHGHVGALFIRREAINGVAFMRSAWETDLLEAQFLMAGGKIILGVQGHVHPVVHMQIEPPPADAEPIYVTRRVVTIAGQQAVRVDAMYPAGNGHRCYCEIVLNGDSFGKGVAAAMERCDDLARAEQWLA